MNGIDYTRAQDASQEAATQTIQDFEQPLAIELRIHQLRQRFVLTPESARTFAAIAFAAEVSA